MTKYRGLRMITCTKRLFKTEKKYVESSFFILFLNYSGFVKYLFVKNIAR